MMKSNYIVIFFITLLTIISFQGIASDGPEEPPVGPGTGGIPIGGGAPLDAGNLFLILPALVYGLRKRYQLMIKGIASETINGSGTTDSPFSKATIFKKNVSLKNKSKSMMKNLIMVTCSISIILLSSCTKEDPLYYTLP